MEPSELRIKNPGAFPLSALPCLEEGAFRSRLLGLVENGLRVSTFFGLPGSGGPVRIVAVLADDSVGELEILSTQTNSHFLALTPQCPQLHWFERELVEQCAVMCQDHPWLKPIRFSPPLPGVTRPGAGPAPAMGSPIGETEFFRLEGPEVHEVAVGPVHAGIIEPGHFRFQCHGETVFHLEISLGYQHRGIERAMVEGPASRAIHWAETLAGDTSIGHATAFCLAREAAQKLEVPPRADAIRAVALELERIANHVGDLGALAGDVGFLPTAAFCGRIRGDALNMTALLCGNRFGRNLVRPGGVVFDLDQATVEELTARLETFRQDVTSAVDLLWVTNSVMSRFERTGPVPTELAASIGLVGPAARASALERDVRLQHPWGYWRNHSIPIATTPHGDVLGRAQVRWQEVQNSLDFISQVLAAIPGGPIKAPAPAELPASTLALGLTEGWRGEIVHAFLTDEHGALARYKVVDPSFHNWFGLAQALRNQAISDFPLCNKSFNLSYCGHDL